MHRLIHRVGVLLIAASLLTATEGRAQQVAKEKGGSSGELFDQIAGLDQKLFDAFNRHDADALMALFTDDLEFFHDKDGLSNYGQTREGFMRLFANVPDIKRELVTGSLQVYPIKGYGAVEMGQHTFCHREKGRDECGTFKFVMLWRNDGGSWKISRVISVDH